MTRHLHSFLALILLSGAAWAQRDPAEPAPPASADPGDEAQQATGGSGEAAPGGGVVIGRPQAIGRPETIGTPQTVGRPQTIGGAFSRDAAPAEVATEGVMSWISDPEPIDDGVDLTPMTDAERQAVEAASGVPITDDADATDDSYAGDADGDPLPYSGGSSEAAGDDGIPMGAAHEDPTLMGTSDDTSPPQPVPAAGDGLEGQDVQSAPGLILGPTDPRTGAMIVPNGGAPTGGSDASGEDALLRDTLDSIESSNERNEALQTQQLEVMEDLAAQNEETQAAQAASAASLASAEGSSARALSLVDEAHREALGGETDLSNVLGQARTSVVDAAAEAASQGRYAREDELGRALLWIESAREAAENHDGVEAMRRLDQARRALNGGVPVDPAAATY